MGYPFWNRSKLTTAVLAAPSFFSKPILLANRCSIKFSRDYFDSQEKTVISKHFKVSTYVNKIYTNYKDTYKLTPLWETYSFLNRN